MGKLCSEIRLGRSRDWETWIGLATGTVAAVAVIASFIAWGFPVA